MLRRSLLFSLMILVVAGLSVAGDKEQAWADSECAVCGGMYAMIDQLSIEQYNLKNGIISITNVAAGSEKEYEKAQMQMMQAMMKLQGGEDLHICGSCTAFGKCMMQGPTQDFVETSTGNIMILTSDNAELVKQLQMWAKKNGEAREEMTKKG